MVHSDDFAVRVLRENLNRYRSLLAAAEASANQVHHLRELVRMTEEQLNSLEHGTPLPTSAPYHGMKLIDAVTSYLETREGTVGIKGDLLPALVKGGALLETPDKARWRVLRTTLSMNPSRVDYDATGDKVKLKK